MASVKETEAGFRNKVVTGVTSLTPATFRTEWSVNEAEKVCNGPAECGCAEHADCGYGGKLRGRFVGRTGTIARSGRDEADDGRLRETASWPAEVPRSLGVREQRRAVKKPANPATGER
jgi:hypothetical protein